MLRSMIIAFSTYSKIPMPRIQWEEKSMRYSMCFFPVVGLVIGLCSLGVFYGMAALGFGGTARAAVLTALPLLISGGIHMDGFLDTMDAKSSYRSREEKLEILKDPHAGAFAIICGGVYLLLSFGLFTEVGETEIVFLALGYAYSRSLSGFSVVTLKKAKKEGMVAATAEASEKNVKWILLAEIIFCGLGYLYLDLLLGMICILVGLLVFFYYREMSGRIFGGITGDLAGYFLQMCEFFLLLGVVLTAKVGAIIF